MYLLNICNYRRIFILLYHFLGFMFIIIPFLAIWQMLLLLPEYFFWVVWLLLKYECIFEIFIITTVIFNVNTHTYLTRNNDSISVHCDSTKRKKKKCRSWKNIKFSFISFTWKNIYVSIIFCIWRIGKDLSFYWTVIEV